MFPKVTLLLGLMVLRTHVWTIPSGFIDISKNLNDFVMSVEFAVFQYNEDGEDEYAYKLLRIRRSQHKRHTWLYLMDLELGRTICKKHDEDLENCPLQEGKFPSSQQSAITIYELVADMDGDIGGGGWASVKVSCTFIVSTIPFYTQFTLVNSTCTD